MTLATSRSATLNVNRDIALAASGAAIDVNSSNTGTVDGIISGGTLNKTGAGSLKLTNANNSFTGGWTIGGDANLDGMINIDDYTQIDSSVAVAVGGARKGWFNGDFNYDGNVDIDDDTIIDSNIPIHGAPFPTAAGVSSSPALSGVAAVPEPASASVIGIAALSLLGKRRPTVRR